MEVHHQQKIKGRLCRAALKHHADINIDIGHLLQQHQYEQLNPDSIINEEVENVPPVIYDQPQEDPHRNNEVPGAIIRSEIVPLPFDIGSPVQFVNSTYDGVPS